MLDINARIAKRINATHDLATLWPKLRADGFSVWEAEDYVGGEQAPWHLYYVGGGEVNVPVEVLYRQKTEEELAEDKELGCTPFKQFIEWIKY